MRNAFGNTFRIALAGESHSPLMSVEINGVPEGIPLSPGDFAEDIDRRRPGRKGTTARTERDNHCPDTGQCPTDGGRRPVPCRG